MATSGQQRAEILQDPRWVQELFSTTRFAWVWLIARVYVGWQWVDSGWGKMQSDAWMGGGTALKGAWERMITIPETGRPAVAYDWYREFIQLLYDAGAWTWFAKVLAVGEWLVGIALIVGVLTGISALIAGFMNFNFAMGGMGPGTNAVMIIITIGVFLAWKTAGWWGIDRWLLAKLGTPWQPGSFFDSTPVTPVASAHTQHPVEQWIRMLVAAGVAILALANLAGTLQIVVLLLAAVLVATTGLGWFSATKHTAP